MSPMYQTAREMHAAQTTSAPGALSLMQSPDRTTTNGRPNLARHQRGITLVELMVGIAIGLMTIGIALGALMASRTMTTTVSDASQLQQQAGYIFRVIGTQLRQTGSLRLNLGPTLDASGQGLSTNSFEKVAFEAKVADFDPAVDSIKGMDSPGSSDFKLEVGFRNYKEQLFAGMGTQLSDCLGLAVSDKPEVKEGNDAKVSSSFVLNAEKPLLECAGSRLPPREGAGGGGGVAAIKKQPIADRVANFSVRYLLQSEPTASYGNPQIQYVSATGVANRWSQVTGVEVCIVLYGTEIMSLPDTASYSDCPAADGTVATKKMSEQAGDRKNRLHMVFRNVYQLRSQGLIG